LDRDCREWRKQPKVRQFHPGSYSSKSKLKRRFQIVEYVIGPVIAIFKTVYRQSHISVERFVAAMNAEGIPNPGKLSAGTRAAHVPQWRISKTSVRQTSRGKSFILAKEISGNPTRSLANCMDTSACIAGAEEDMHEIATALGKSQKHLPDPKIFAAHCHVGTHRLPRLEQMSGSDQTSFH